MENLPAKKNTFGTPAKIFLAGVFLALIAAVPLVGRTLNVGPEAAPAPQVAGQAFGSDHLSGSASVAIDPSEEGAAPPGSGSPSGSRAPVPASGVQAVPARAGSPVRLSIPKIGVSANVQHVGVNAVGNMATPTNAYDVAWYRPGVAPGNQGSAVIAGHVNTRDTAQGVFYRLNDLAVGDIVEVTDGLGKKLRFRVVQKKLLDYTASPEEVFGATSARRLNLITCTGDWLPDQKTYDQRLVVFTELIS